MPFLLRPCAILSLLTACVPEDETEVRDSGTSDSGPNDSGPSDGGISDGGCVSCVPGRVVVWASVDDGHTPDNVLDGAHDDESRWSAEGTPWIRFDLAEPETVDGVQLHFMGSNERITYFTIQTSPDGQTWTDLLDSESSGSSSGFEDFSFAETTTKHLRIVGGGNSSSGWTSIIEVAFVKQGTIVVGDGVSTLVECLEAYHCDDLNTSTIDSCDAQNSCVFENPNCGPTDSYCPPDCLLADDPDCPECRVASDCDDQDVTTVDSCDNGTCSRTPVSGNVYHVDAVNGSDTNDGSEQSPFQSYDDVRPLLVEGDVVYFYDGNYGTLVEGRSSVEPPYDPVDVFTDWVTLRAAPGHQPTFDKVELGARSYNDGGGWQFKEFEGVADVYLRLIGFHVSDGVSACGMRHVELKDSSVRRIGPWNGSMANVHKSAVGFLFSNHMLVENCDITDTAIGIHLQRSRNVTVRNNHIHWITHDGIQILSIKNALVEGNRIHNMDDGLNDDGSHGDNVVDLSGSWDWNMHADGIHFYPIMDGGRVDANENVTVRGNIFYHLGNAAIQFNDKSNTHHYNIIIENNILGPSRGNTFNSCAASIDGFIFRNNTTVFVPGGVTFQSRFQTIVNNGFTVEGSCGTHHNVEIYNNILVNEIYRLGNTASRYDHNICIEAMDFSNDHQGCYRTEGSIELTENQFQNPENYDGILIPNSPAINGGTRTTPTGDPIPDFFEQDIYGTARDAQPDIGAVEAD